MAPCPPVYPSYEVYAAIKKADYNVLISLLDLPLINPQLTNT